MKEIVLKGNRIALKVTLFAAGALRLQGIAKTP